MNNNLIYYKVSVTNSILCLLILYTGNTNVLSIDAASGIVEELRRFIELYNVVAKVIEDYECTLIV